jgi:hypothetical protein
MPDIEGQNRHPISQLSRRWTSALTSDNDALIDSHELNSRPFRDELSEVEQLHLLLDQIRDGLRGSRAEAANLLDVELTNISRRLAERITRTEMRQRTGTPAQISTCQSAYSVFIL